MNLTLSADDKITRVPVFVQPSGEQDCLLGMNALPALADGDLLLPSPERSAERIPGSSGVFVQAKVEGKYREGDELIFEQDKTVLSTHGLISPDSVAG